MHHKQVALEALCLMATARFCMLFIPFRRLAPHLGTIHTDTLMDPRSQGNPQLIEIKRTVHRIGKKTWWKSECFVRASAIAWMLRRRGRGYTIYLGVAKDEAQQLIAHAWIRSGAQWMSGAGQRDRYTVVATFSAQPRRKDTP
ncbi:lasso peptide biosynthesis B2 protein [Cohnella faecalis]|uniref:lasso peptide biosynthesis B2 protein n=1 Tax=Cohnella faecalis TaxID=2315694 RepID=UPI0013146CCC|nr:lasso peptide biosynthesis B2 protein [Cohnella faecalis]